MGTVPVVCVGASGWWPPVDSGTQRLGLKMGHFVRDHPTGDPRSAGVKGSDRISGGAGQGPQQKIVSKATGSARQPAVRGVRFLAYLAYALTVALGIPAAILLLLLLTGPRRRRVAAA